MENSATEQDDKRIIGRAKRRREQQSTEPGTESGSESGTESRGNQGWWSNGNSGERGNTGGSSEKRSASDRRKENETIDVQANETVKITVENTEAKPKRASTPKTSTAKPKVTTAEVFGPADVERFLVFAFGMYATVNGREWWKVDKKEVESFSPQAANLMNKYLGENAAKAKEGSEFLAVGMGLLGIIMVRVQKDNQVRRAVVEQAKAEQHAQEDIYTGEPYSENGHSREALIGAQATGPFQPIFGNGAAY